MAEHVGSLATTNARPRRSDFGKCAWFALLAPCTTATVATILLCDVMTQQQQQSKPPRDQGSVQGDVVTVSSESLVLVNGRRWRMYEATMHTGSMYSLRAGSKPSAT